MQVPGCPMRVLSLRLLGMLFPLLGNDSCSQRQRHAQRKLQLDVYESHWSRNRLNPPCLRHSEAYYNRKAILQ